MKKRLLQVALVSSVLSSCLVTTAYSEQISVTVHAGLPDKPISPDLFGIFFEDLNYAADGGLYAEMVQNRSFEYSPLDHSGWHAFAG